MWLTHFKPQKLEEGTLQYASKRMDPRVDKNNTTGTHVNTRTRSVDKNNTTGTHVNTRTRSDNLFFNW